MALTMNKIRAAIKWTLYLFLILTVLSIFSAILSIPYARLIEKNTNLSSDRSGNYWLRNARLSKDFSDLRNAQVSNTHLYDLRIENGFITAIIESTDKPLNQASVDELDLQGKWLYPGLIDLHVHVFDKSDLAAYLAHGVTSVRNMMGFPIHLRWREQITRDEVIGPNLITASPTINSGSNGGPFHKYVNNAREVASLVRQYKAQGYDLIKFYDGLNKEQFLTLANTANEIDIPFSGHIPYDMELSEVLETGPTSIEHIEEIFHSALDYDLGLNEFDEVVSLFEKHQIPIVTTLTAYNNIFLASENRQQLFTPIRLNKISPLIRFIGEKQLQPVDNAEYRDWIIKKHKALEVITQSFHKSRIPLVIGTDTGPALTIPGQSLIDEMNILKLLGFTNNQIIAMATIDSARVLGLKNVDAMIQIGEKADLLILDTDPLVELNSFKTPFAVIKSGKYFGQEKLDQLQIASKQHQSYYQTFGYLLEHYILL